MEELNKYELIEELLSKVDLLDKKTYLHEAFFKIMKIIPLAQKGTLFEIINDELIAIESYGYDTELISQVKMNTKGKNKSFIHASLPFVKAETIYVENSKNKNHSPKNIEIFKKLGTFEGFHTLYSPLVVNNEIIGIFCLDNFDDGFDDYSKRTLTVFANVISNFYDKILRQKTLSETYYNAIKALVSAIEVKDPYTKGHGERVSNLSKKIATEMNLSNKQIEDITIAALLHDVGKIGIPEHILNKVEKLTEDELKIIQSHPEMSRKIVSSIDLNISKIVYSHHELLNGSGYPLGLKEGNIPIGSLIIQVADIFDALTSVRAYRAPCSFKEALDYLNKHCGTLYHEGAVKALNKIIINENS